MNKPGRIAFVMVLAAVVFAAIAAVAAHFQFTMVFLVGWIGVAGCVAVGFVAVFAAIVLQLWSDRRRSR
jgi:hypothetical protein